MNKIFFLLLLVLFSHTKSVSQNNYIDSLKQKLASSKEDTAKVNLLYNIGWFYVWAYADTAANYAKQGLQLAQKLNYKYGEALCMQQLSICFMDLGNYPNGLDFGFKAQTIFENLHDTSQLIWTFNVLMIYYEIQEDYSEALIYGYKAKKLLQSSPVNSFQTGVVLSTISSVYQKTTHLDSALYYAEKAYEFNQEWSGILQPLGDIQAKIGHTDLALNYYRKGITNAMQNRVYIGLINIYNEMSKVFESTGKMDSSVYYANKSITQEGIDAYPEGVLKASTQLAHLYESQGKTDSTIKYLKLTIALNDSLFNRKKTREAQSFSFNEKLHQQELAAQQQQDENKIRMYALLAVVIVFLVIGFFLWRNNRHKQKVNLLLTEQKQKVESTLTELKSTQAQLIQSEKMASLGELTAGIAHEIQNPLNFVNNFSEVNNELIDELESELKNNNNDEAILIAKDIKGNEEKINYHGKRADAIVKGMLQHSKASTGKKEPSDINALCDEYLRLSYHGMRAKDKSFIAELKTDFDETIGKINIVPQDIGRVLLNLFTNAFYAVNEKKKTSGEDYQPTISVQTKKLNGRIEISVSDNGNGFPQNIIAKIFQPFFTTKPTGQGTGLGLSLSYDIIKAHGGEIKVETREGKGSEFIIELPLK